MSNEPSDLRPPHASQAQTSAAPELQQPSDRVPRLRPDLLILPRKNEAGLFDVSLAEEGARAFTLYDIEVSIARMLDGKRTVAQVIEAAAKIGIPASVDSLDKFVRQLRRYRFLLDETPAEGAEHSAWAPREEWRPEVRELYQSALRTFRNDRPSEARGYLEALMQIEPEILEAHELMKRVEERILAGDAPPLPSFDALHAEEVDLSGEQIPEGELAEDGEGWEGAPPRVSEDAYPDEEDEARPRRRWPLVAVAVAALALGGVAAIPLPARVSGSAVLVPAGTPQALPAPRSGKIAELLAKPGTWVKPGQQLLRLDQTDLDAQAQMLQQRLAWLDSHLGRLQRRAGSRSVRKAKADLEKKQAQLARLERERDHLSGRHDRRSRRKLHKLEKSIARKQHDVVKAQASYDKKAGTEELAKLTQEKSDKTAALAEVEQKRKQSVLVASGSGAFEPGRKVGDAVIQGETIARLVDSRKLKVNLGIPERQATKVKEGQPVSIRLSGTDHALRTVVLTTSGESAGPGLVRATAAIDNADLKLAPGASGLAEIDCGADPLFRRLLGQK